MIKGGIGGTNTRTGLHFEGRISLSSALLQVQGYSVSGDRIFKEGDLVAELFAKNKIYKNLLEPKGINYKDYISKKLLPDDAILVNGKLFIVEIKFQNVAGSVDEKLQTCDFKIKQYRKLLLPIGIEVEYVYVLSDWFKKPEYRDMLEYVQSVGCYYFFNEIPLTFLGI